MNSRIDSLDTAVDAPQRTLVQPSALPVDVVESRATRPSVFRIVWPFVAALAALTLFSALSLEILMSLRSYAQGENLWVKTQKTATIQMLRHTQTGDLEALAAHDAAAATHGHFKRARIAMESRTVADDDVAAALERAGVPADDARKAAWLNRWFGFTPHQRRILTIWRDADDVFDALTPLRAELASSRPSAERLEAVQRSVMAVDDRIVPLSQAFASELLRASYAVYSLLLLVGVLLAVALATALVLRTRSLWKAHDRVERLLDGERARASVTLASIGDGVVVLDERGRITYLNHAARALTDFRGQASAIAPRPAVEVLRIFDKKRGTEVDLADLARGGQQHSEGEQVLMGAGGSPVPVSWAASPIQGQAGDDGLDQGVVVVIRNVEKESMLLGRLRWLASHDPLTKLPNRREFEACLHATLTASAEGDRHVVLLFDLDNFKIVNDTSGHAAGDELLRLVSTVARAHVREGDTLARMGGDEFAILLPRCPPDVGEQRAEAIRLALHGVRLVWQGRTFTDVTASIGVVHVDARRKADTAGVLSCADMACYMAKDRGRDQVAVYHHDEVAYQARHGEMSWPQRLRDAVSSNRLALFVQPYADLRADGSASRCELLLRLYDESGKLVSPGDFLPAAERYGMMPLLDRWVVNRALELIAERNAAGMGATTYGINLSGAAFADDSFLAQIQHLFAKHAVAYDQVCFEITETQAVSDLQRAATFIRTLRDLGAAFALDDFGSGMSSMGYLKHLPVDVLKIDGKLVREMVADPVNHAMVAMIANLGRVLGMKTVGEFAEDAAIIDALRGVGVDFAQGYGVARPMPFSAQTCLDTRAASARPAAGREPVASVASTTD